MNTPVVALVLAARNLQCHPALEIRQGHRGAHLASVFSPLDWVRVSRSGQSVDPPHERAEIALDMSTKLGPNRGSVLETDPVTLTTPPQFQAVKFLAIVDVYPLGSG